MSYYTDMAANVRKTLKENFPDMKFSIRVVREGLGGLHVSVLSGPADLRYLDGRPIRNYSLNPSAIKISYQDFVEKSKNTIKKIYSKVLEVTKWEDRSSSREDFYNVSFYFRFMIGDRGKVYQAKAQ